MILFRFLYLPEITTLKDENGQLVMDSKEKANLLNNFFVSVFVSEPPGPLPIFDIRYNGTPVTKLSVIKVQYVSN